MANGNAFAFMRLGGLEPDDCGTLAAEDLPSYAARALELMNRPALRQLELRPGTCRQSMKTVAEGNVISIVQGPKSQVEAKPLGDRLPYLSVHTGGGQPCEV